MSSLHEGQRLTLRNYQKAKVCSFSLISNYHALQFQFSLFVWRAACLILDLLNILEIWNILKLKKGNLNEFLLQMFWAHKNLEAKLKSIGRKKVNRSLGFGMAHLMFISLLRPSEQKDLNSLGPQKCMKLCIRTLKYTFTGGKWSTSMNWPAVFL